MDTTMRTVTIDGRRVALNGERNLLEVIRAAKIDLPTFCYHSELSIYGACRLCVVELEGRGVVPACSTPPEDGMVLRTNTARIRELRKIIVELLLANHDRACTTCPRSETCQLQTLARRLGIDEVRFRSVLRKVPVDASTPSLVRDPNKCVLCGDCVRFCEEVQSVGAIDFAHRGPRAAVCPSFGKDLSRAECVYCGQCARVCPTGAITVRSDVDAVWKALSDKDTMVVAQLAPAVRVAIGEQFGLPVGANPTGQLVAALRTMGFARVFDTSFAADLTVVEEANEFLRRLSASRGLPLFTSCCPAWVTFVEQYYPDFREHLSTCRSPQQMFGAVAKETLPGTVGIERKKLVVVSIMPCTAKKFEAGKPGFTAHGTRDVDFVLTTQELARMIEESGVRFAELPPSSFDMPLGFKTGAGVIFGSSGGVTEAVLRYAIDSSVSGDSDAGAFAFVRADGTLREATVTISGKEIRIAIVQGLGAARKVIKEVKAGRAKYHFVEVMACPGGCVGGAGQPVTNLSSVRRGRADGLYAADKTLDLHGSQENPYITELYRAVLGRPGCGKAHELLHTQHVPRKRLVQELTES